MIPIKHQPLIIMRNIILTTVLSLLFISLSSAQVNERNEPMSLGTQNAITISLPNTDVRDAEKVWQQYMDDYYDSKAKWNRKVKEWVVTDADVSALGRGEPVNIFATFDKSGNGVMATVWVQVGSSFLSSRTHADRYDDAEKMMMRYALEVAKASVRQELEEEEKMLNRMETDLRKLKSANERYHKDIEKAQEAIRKAEEDIVKNVREQEEMAKKIEQQQELLKKIRKKLNNI